MWQTYLFRAMQIAAERTREAERESQLRELRRALSRGPDRTARRPVRDRTDG